MEDPEIRLPEQSFIETQLLLHLYRVGRPIEPKDVYGPLADACFLTPEQRDKPLRWTEPLGKLCSVGQTKFGRQGIPRRFTAQLMEPHSRRAR